MDDDFYSKGGGGWANSAPAPPPAVAPPPTVAPVDSFYSKGGGGWNSTPTGSQSLPEGDDAWSDYAHYGMHEIQGVLAGVHSGAAGWSSSPEMAAAHEAEAQVNRDNQEQSLSAMTPAGRTAAEAPLLSAQTLAHPLRALAMTGEQTAIQVAPYAGAAALAGPLALPATAALGATLGYGDVRNNVHEAVQNAPDDKLAAFDPDFAGVVRDVGPAQARTWLANKVLTTTSADKWGAVAGAIMGGAGGAELGGLPAKLGIGEAETAALSGNPITGIAKNAVRGFTEMAVPGAITQGVTQHAEAQAGAAEEPTVGDILHAGVTSGLAGATFSVAGGAYHGPNRTQTGGKATVARETPEQEASYVKPKAPATAPADVGADNTAKEPTGANVGAGAGEAAAINDTLLPPKVTQGVKPPEVVPTPSVQSKVAPVEDQQGSPPAGVQQEGPSPPQLPPAPQPLPRAAPPVEDVGANQPEGQAELRSQHADLLNSASPRDYIIYPKGVQPFDIPRDAVGVYGKTKLPAPDGRTVQFRYDPNGRALTKGKIKNFYDNNDLAGLQRIGDVQKGEAVQRIAAGEPGTITAERDAAGNEVRGAVGTEATAPSQAAAMEASKTPGNTVQVENVADNFAARQAKVAQEGDVQSEVVPPITQGVSLGDQIKARVAAQEAEAKAKVQALEAERAAKKQALIDEMNAKLAKGEPVSGTKINITDTRTEVPPNARILRPETDEERAAAEAQVKAQDEAATAKTEASKAQARAAKEPEDIKPGNKSTEQKDAMKAANAIASDVVARHLPQDREALAIDPTQKGGAGSRKMLQDRAKAMVADAEKAGYEFKGRAMHRTDPATRHTNDALLLYEAKLLAGKKVLKTEDVTRFLRNEHDLKTNGQDAYERVLGERKQTGKETAVERGKQTGEAQGVEDIDEAAKPAAGSIERPDVGDEYEAAKERVADEDVAREPGEARQLTPNEQRAKEASDRARAKLEAQEQTERTGRTRPSEGEGRAEAPAPRAAMGFKTSSKFEGMRPKVEGKINLGGKKAAASEEPLADRIEHDDSDRTINYKTKDGEVKIWSSGQTTAREAVDKHLDLKRYSPELRPMIERLRDAILKVAGDTPVHFVSHDDLVHALGDTGKARGLYSPRNDVILLNKDRLNQDTPLHELFHAATHKAIVENPDLRRVMTKLRDEIKANAPHFGEDNLFGRKLAIALKNPEEMLTYLMTEPDIQRTFKDMKISRELADEIGVPKWRKATAWEGVVNALREAFGLKPRDTSAIEAAMAISEQSLWRDPRGAGMAMEAAGRSIQDTLHDRLDEGREGGFYRHPKHMVEAVRNLDVGAVKGIAKDIVTNKSPTFLKGHLRWLAGNNVEAFHGHLFKDAKGQIIKAINTAREKVSHTYNVLRGADARLRAQAYLMDRKYADRMGDYSNVVGMSVRYNIHADRPPPENKSTALKDVQQNANWERAHDMYNALPDGLQRRYREEKEYYGNTQQAAGREMLGHILSVFDPPEGSTLDEVTARARKGDMTDADWEHYEKQGAEPYLRKAASLMSKKDVYFNSQRSGDFVTSGHYEMPTGGSDTAHSGEQLPDNTREFDTEDEARQYAANTHLPADISSKGYAVDPNNPGKFLPHVLTKDGRKLTPAKEDVAATKYRVQLERQHTEFAKTRAEAERNRKAMEDAGVKDVTGVMNRRDDATWGKLGLGQQKALERRINSNRNMSPEERQNVQDMTRQMMLAGQSAYSPHMMQRRKVFGADYSTAEGLDSYSRSINQMTARNAHRPELDQAMTRLDNHTKAMSTEDPDNALRRSAVAGEMWDRVHSDSLQAKVSPMIHKIMTYAFTNFLMRPSHVLLQQLHPYVYSIPHIAARYGTWASLKGQRQAMIDLGGRGHNLMEGLRAAGRQIKSLKEGDIDKALALAKDADPTTRMIANLKDADERAAMTELMETNTLHSSYDASVFAGGGMDRWNSIMKQFTDAMEANNRLSTALNAYRLEKAQHGSEAGLEYARNTIEHTQGVYSQANMAPIFKNPLMKPIMQFRQQPANLFIMLVKDAMGAAKGDPEAKRALYYQLATAGAIGGMSGMPTFPFKAAGLASQLVGGPGPDDFNDAAHRLGVDTIGNTATNVLETGLPALAGPYGVSLGPRAGLNPDFLFGTPKSGSFNDMLTYVAGNAIGASGSLFKGAIDGLDDLENGDYEKGAEKVLPGVIRDMFKSVRDANSGVMVGDKQIKEGSFASMMTDLAGFSNLSDMRAQEGHYAMQRAIRAQAKEDNVGTKLKNRYQQKQTVLGIDVTKKNRAIAGEYANAYE